MKKFLTILISFSLATAAGAMAQQAEEQASPSPAKKQHGKAQPSQTPKEPGARKERAETKGPARAEGAAKPEQSVQSSPTPRGMTKGPGPARGKEQAEQRKKEQRAATTPTATTKPATGTAAGTTAQSPAPAAPQAAKGTAQAKKPTPQVVQSVKSQHASFRAQPKPEQVPTVTFSQTYRIQGAEQWQGPQYEVFRSYHPEWHDAGWYRSNFGRVELIGGGYYYFNNGYWYPAWGYDPAAQYYAYDAPIYVGRSAEPPDRVIADVQAILQYQGYYKGEVDGLLGPLTREALTAYQRDNGLYATAVIDEPTLSSLGLG
jgi:Putative peptidoglycan binding domain